MNKIETEKLIKKQIEICEQRLDEKREICNRYSSIIMSVAYPNVIYPDVCEKYDIVRTEYERLLHEREYLQVQLLENKLKQDK